MIPFHFFYQNPSYRIKIPLDQVQLLHIHQMMNISIMLSEAETQFLWLFCKNTSFVNIYTKMLMKSFMTSI